MDTNIILIVVHVYIKYMIKKTDEGRWHLTFYLEGQSDYNQCETIFPFNIHVE